MLMYENSELVALFGGYYGIFRAVALLEEVYYGGWAWRVCRRKWHLCFLLWAPTAILPPL